MEESLNLSRLCIQDWSYLWTEYDYRRKPSLKTGANFNSHLIQTDGRSFKYCLNKNSSRLLKKLFQNNLEATAEKAVDRNYHPIGLVAGAPGSGKSRVTLAWVHRRHGNYTALRGDL